MSLSFVYSFYFFFFFFFFNDTATTEIYTLSLHDALPISMHSRQCSSARRRTAASGLQRLPSRYSSSPNRFGLTAPIRIPSSPACRPSSPQSSTRSQGTWIATLGQQPVSSWTSAASASRSQTVRAAPGHG